MKHLIKLHLSILFYFLFTVESVYAQNFRQLTNKDGLSNSAVLSLCQDSRGMIWIGSCDGLNTFDGRKVSLYRSFNSSEEHLSGNLIDKLRYAKEDVLWVQTNYGLDRLDIRRNSIQNFDDFMGRLLFCESPSGMFYVLKDDGYLYYFNAAAQVFQKLDVPEIDFSKALALSVDSNNILWIFGKGHSTQSFQITETNEKDISINSIELFNHSSRLLWAFVEEDAVYFVDEAYDLYEYDFNNHKAYFIATLGQEIEARGEISSLVKKDNDFYLGFKNSGLVRLQYLPNQKNKYRTVVTNIHCGIFCMMKDKFQDIIWIGTDGQGVYMYLNDISFINNTLLDTPAYGINNPVRCLYYDVNNTLWIGTKGSGILKMNHYMPGISQTADSFELFTTENSSLTDNSVYSISPSKRDVLWIGTENGFNYFDNQSKQLYKLPITVDNKRVKYIHSIQELNDTTLWVSTVGEGIIKVILYPNRIPRVKVATRILVEDGRMASNYFFTSYLEGDSVLWLGNRGYGLYHLNVNTEDLISYRFDTIANNRMANDIFAIHHNEQGYWLGTNAGVLHFTSDGLLKKEVELLTDGTIHGILEDSQHNLWYSTNQGLICHNLQTGAKYVYNNRNGLSITEFSDGAFYKDPCTHILYFGGNNGFVSIMPGVPVIENYAPTIYLIGLSILGEMQNLNNYLSDENTINLDYDQNFFQLNFLAIDYINSNNYSYFYKIQEINNQWIANHSSSDITFSNLSPGKYTLWVKYINNVTAEEGQPTSFFIVVSPPWYLSTWAYILYAIIFIAICASVTYRIFLLYRRKQQHIIAQMKQQKKEEVYEAKLRFFTNITHEFCTPLTLIYGPCEKILSHSGTDLYIRKYAQLILQNTEKLNGLILELLEFRRLETGHKELNIQSIEISEELTRIAKLFSELAESRGIDYCLEIVPDITWNIDISCFHKIVGNLISNAFKYTPNNGQITIRMKVEDMKLILSISNTGKGIRKEDLSKIFDRYKILDSFETNMVNSRTGLGLAICKSMVTLLNGDIKVNSIPDQITDFMVTLPVLAVTESEANSVVCHDISLENQVKETFQLEFVERKYDKNKQTIMVIDDDPSMLWFTSEIFVNQYNVLSYGNADKALADLECRQPALIISDVMMPGTDGLTFVQKLKQNKLWNHIPLILLSALHHENEQIKGIEAGADAYVTKPFNVKYLEQLVYRLIKRENDLKEYYHSAFSSFAVENGKLQNKEDQLFMDKLMTLVEQYLTDTTLSVDIIASELGYSTRQFYRKLRLITDKSPADLIKDCRISVAERLLMEQNFTIEEIIYRTGFNNRSSFYKAFSRRYGMPPMQYRKLQKKQIEQELSSRETS